MLKALEPSGLSGEQVGAGDVARSIRVGDPVRSTHPPLPLPVV